MAWESWCADPSPQATHILWEVGQNCLRIGTWPQSLRNSQPGPAPQPPAPAVPCMPAPRHRLSLSPTHLPGQMAGKKRDWLPEPKQKLSATPCSRPSFPTFRLGNVPLDGPYVGLNSKSALLLLGQDASCLPSLSCFWEVWPNQDAVVRNLAQESDEEVDFSPFFAAN